MTPFDYPYDCDVILQKKRRLRRELLTQSGLIPKKIAILSGSTIGEIKPILELFLLHHGIQPEFYEGEYARYYENAVFDDGSLRAFAPDMIYVHTTVQNLSGLPCPADSDVEAEEKLAAEVLRWQSFWDACCSMGAIVIQNNFEFPNVRVMGSVEAVDRRGAVRFVRRMNEALARYAEAHRGFLVNDINYLAAELGLDHWFSPTMWYAYQYALDLSAVPALCASIANIIKSLYGKNKKSIACDLDNTLWGGVIGDDGVQGIQLGEESPSGRAFTALQRYLKLVSQTGVLLNVNSKNEAEIAKSGFSRPESVLHEEDFICFTANWQPKDENLAQMASQLNLLPESFVFLDDNPAEREIVRRRFPQTAVPELTEPEHYVRTLARSGYFEVTSLSADDKKRSEMYRENAQRAQAQAAFSDYSDYLRSLEMKAVIAPFDTAHAARITQLMNKTNQFNLTTRRYTDAEVSACMSDGNTLTLYASLADRFGDNGIVSALIGRVQDGILTIEEWVMSCRVFKRDLELAVFDALIAYCRTHNITSIEGNYLPTAKNAYVRTLYPTLGFSQTAESEEGTHYCFDIPAESAPLCSVIEVTSLL